MREMGLVMVLVIAVAACGGDDDGGDPCADDACLCLDENVCEIDCLGDGCDLTCADTSECYFLCDDGCTATCDSVSVCEVDCGEGCDVLCTSLSECRVVMVSGVASCEGVSDCAVDCVVGDALEPAEDCGDGTFACGGC